jgi:hypothetical protein
MYRWVYRGTYRFVYGMEAVGTPFITGGAFVGAVIGWVCAG